MRRLNWLALFLLLALVAGAEKVSAQARLNDATVSRTTASKAQTSDDDAWHASFDPIVTNLITLDDQIRAMEVKLNDIAKIPDRSSRLLELRAFEKSALDKEAEALKVGLDVIAKADSFLPTSDLTMETREKTVLVIETKLLLVITRVVQIKSTIIIIKEGRIPPTIPPTPTATPVVGTAGTGVKPSNPRQ